MKSKSVTSILICLLMLVNLAVGNWVTVSAEETVNSNPSIAAYEDQREFIEDFSDLAPSGTGTYASAAIPGFTWTMEGKAAGIAGTGLAYADPTFGTSVSLSSDPDSANNGVLISDTIRNGLSKLSFSYGTGKWGSGKDRKFSVYINDVEIGAEQFDRVIAVPTRVYTYTWEASDEMPQFEGDVVIKFIGESNSYTQGNGKVVYPNIMIDDIHWTIAVDYDPYVEITGVPVVGNTLTSNEFHVNDEDVVSYKWIACNGTEEVVVSAEKDFAITDDCVGKTLKVVMTVNGVDYVSPSTYTVIESVKDITVTFDAYERNYDGTDVADLVAHIEGINPTDNVQLSYTTQFSDKAVGENKPLSVKDILITGTDSYKYQAVFPEHIQGTINPVTITATVKGINKVYDGETNARVSFAFDGVVTGDQVSANYHALFDSPEIGEGKTVYVTNINLSGRDAGNYIYEIEECTVTANITLEAESRTPGVGDTGATFDLSKLDPKYPQMEEWIKAGVEGGIPVSDSWALNKAKLTTDLLEKPEAVPSRSYTIGFEAKDAKVHGQVADTALQGATKSDDIQSKIDEVAAAGGGIITLENGYYYLDKPIFMPSNIVLRGEEAGKVILYVAANDAMLDPYRGHAVLFATMDGDTVVGSENAGLENLVFEGCLGKPREDWNDHALVEVDTNTSILLFDKTTHNCWLHTVSVINGYRQTVNCSGYNNTFSNVYSNGAFNKGGGGAAYFIIAGHNNLMTGCLVTHLRHFSIQAGTAEYNVVYDNVFRQEVSFHHKDLGNNLIENNEIYLPGPNDEIERTGKYSSLGYPEYYDFPILDGTDSVFSSRGIRDGYVAIMGPWSIQHQISEELNYILNNRVTQNNQSIKHPWSEENIVYVGPFYVKPADKYTNFVPKDEYPAPIGGTFYPVVIEDTSH